MFYRLQPLSNQQEYIDSLKIIGSLSYLFSESTTPYLYYRIAEKLFCKAFDANDLSRGDIALDASKEKIGIGLKTFLKNNDKTLQKVAEFNKDRHLYEHKSSENLIYVIANLRNERISFAENLSEVTRSLYHCVTRAEGMFYIYEESMLLIDIENINSIQKVKNTIRFNDKQHEYTFSLSKSTLLKRFDTSICQEKFPITIYENPLETIQNCFRQQNEIFQETKKLQDTIYLPLYGKNKIVSPKSGLNQWNALGRKRDPNEIYIPIPSKIHHHKPTFFPNRDTPFTLYLPNQKTLNAKVCQDNSKALMSNPNSALGEWLLRHVLCLKEGELLTYKKLETIGIDAVRLDKIDAQNYKISFASTGSYELFLESYDISY